MSKARLDGSMSFSTLPDMSIFFSAILAKRGEEAVPTAQLFHTVGGGVAYALI